MPDSLDASFVTDAVGILALAVLCVMISHNRSITRRSSRLLLAASVTAMVAMIAEMGCVAFESAGIFTVEAYWAFNMIGFSISPFVGYLLGLTFCDRSSRFDLPLLVPSVLNAILVLSSPLTGLIFSLGPSEAYRRGPLFWVFVVAYLSGIAFCLTRIYLAFHDKDDNAKRDVIATTAFLVCGTSLQVVKPELHATWLCVSFTLILLYAFACEEGQTCDALTGLLNQSVFRRDLEEESRGSQVVVFDIDAFKQVNDTWGHRFGDWCIIQVADAMAKSFGPMGKCYRIGGDEFCAIARHAGDDEIDAARRAFIAELASIRSNECRLPTVSVGIARNDGSTDIKATIELADAQMYSHKRSRAARRDQRI